MKIFVIGSTQYVSRMLDYKNQMEDEGHEVRLPCLDDNPGMNELDILSFNRKNIEWADEVHMIWDRRSTGTVFDFGMVFALRKPFRIAYLEQKTFENAMRQYESLF